MTDELTGGDVGPGSWMWTPTAADIEHITRMCKFWLPEHYIAEILNVTLNQYRRARDADPRIAKAEAQGRAHGAKRLYETTFEVAVEKKNVNMLMFVLKSQEKWRDSDPINLNIANFSGQLPTNEEAILILQKATQPRLAGPVEIAPLEGEPECEVKE